jgi:5-hydroxyisourate hydrolase-like protein (transthyretin family)
VRVFLRQRAIPVTPGRPVTLELDITNTLLAIDGLSAQVVGPPGVIFTSEPPVLPLFPDTTGRLVLRVTLPASLPAGRHPAEVMVLSAVEPDRPEHIPLMFDVAAQPGVALTVVPALQSGRHRARYTVMCDNTGNTPLEVALMASDANRALRGRFESPLVDVAPGESVATPMVVKGRRHLLGGEISHAIKVLATAGGLEAEAQARFRQAPVIPRGARTSLVLGIIVAAWAAAFLFGLNKAFGSDPLTKEVPASFYAAAKVSPGGNALGLIAGLSSDAPPAGAVPKTGIVEGVGGTIDGTVLAASTGQGVGRITVQAVQDAPTGPAIISSAATAADGTYSLVGLLPGLYKLNFTADGFTDLWYPAATSEATASTVSLGSMQVEQLLPATVTGMPGSITGLVNTGQTPQVPVTVTVLPEQGTTSGPIGTVTTDANGHYVVPNLATPGSYDLSFSAAGYQAGSDVEVLDGGDQRTANTVTLSAGNGDIDGLVTDGTNPLGGVAITATANGQTVTSATPTTGTVGHFAINGLATPATYLLTFTKAGYGTQTVAVHLGPGAVNNNLSVVLSGGTGIISGLVSGPKSPGGTAAPLGGVTVTVNGGTSPVTTQTLTAGSIGTYMVSGLATPGNYTVTFTDGGYASQTVPVTLTSNGSASGINAGLSLTVGVISGTVGCTQLGVSPCPASGILSGVTVTVNDGNSADTRTTLTAGTDSPGPTPTSAPINFTISSLPSGSYSVTFSLAGFNTQTTFIQLHNGEVVDQSFTMVPG